ncbi:response regulator [Pseudoroseicyclus sp. CXY001]|uniref:response regulator n=1 Tax=Pseudoroseicyclus sp. CXY001 TaxID=3242492 RepID=UPI003570B9CD
MPRPANLRLLAPGPAGARQVPLFPPGRRIAAMDHASLLAAPPLAPRPEEAPPLRLVSTRPAMPLRLRVLVLEDSEVDQIRIARLLGHTNGVVETEFTRSLTEFEEALDDGRVDIAILDYSLPDGTALDALHKLRQHPGQAAARPIVVAGEGRTEMAVAAMKAGSCDFIEKGALTEEILRRAIASALAGAIRHPNGEAEAVEAVLAAVDELCLAQLRPATRAMVRQVDEVRRHRGAGPEAEQALQELGALCHTLMAFVGALSGEVQARAARVS